MNKDLDNSDTAVDILEEDEAAMIEGKSGFHPIEINRFQRCRFSGFPVEPSGSSIRILIVIAPA